MIIEDKPDGFDTFIPKVFSLEDEANFYSGILKLQVDNQLYAVDKKAAGVSKLTPLKLRISKVIGEVA